MSLPLWAARAIVVVLGLAGWFSTQAVIARRAFPQGRIGDRLHAWTEPLNRSLREHPRRANGLLIVTSAVIDLLGLFLVGLAVFGPSIRPFLGLAILFALRQICQGLCALPAPEGMIWRDPGFPSLLVTYGTTSDLFFSGHTAIAVYGALELAHRGGPAFAILGAAIVLVEAATVLVLRAHYTMDVFAGAVTALWVWCASSALAPGVDAWLARILAGGGS
jgi:PAP2 superfamily C-terminal